MLASSGFICECCGLCADKQCVKEADKLRKCKDKFVNVQFNESNSTEGQSSVLHFTPTGHLWVNGNLPLNCDYCYVCARDIDYHGKPGLYGYHCAWCQRATHTNCYEKTISDDVSSDEVIRTQSL